MFARFGQLLGKFDESQFIKVRIFWFLFQNDDSHSCRYTRLPKTGRSGWVELPETSTRLYFLNKELLPLHSLVKIDNLFFFVPEGIGNTLGMSLKLFSENEWQS